MMKLAEWALSGIMDILYRILILMSKATLFSCFLPICIPRVTYLEKRRKNNILCGGSTKQAGDSELSTNFIEAENTVG